MLQNFDISSYKVCSEPNIWVFDDLLSERFLNHVDAKFDSDQLFECHGQKEGGRVRNSRSLHLLVDKDSQELVDVIRRIGQIDLVENCSKLCISDVWGDTQSPHLDHINLSDIARTFQQLDFLDLSKQSAHKRNHQKIVPTLSFVVYYNNVGGIKFPHAKLRHGTISGKRGRIIMFQNYIDTQRPAHDEMATHYGVYVDDINKRKRVMAMGILANETPSMQPFESNGSLDTPHQDQRRTRGLIYCPGVNDDGIRHDWYQSHHQVDPPTSPPPKPAPPPKDDMIFILEATFEAPIWSYVARDIGGNEIRTVTSNKDQDETVGWLRELIECTLDPSPKTPSRTTFKDKYIVELMLCDGTMLSKDNDDWPLEAVFGEAPKTRDNVAKLLGLEPNDNVYKTFEAWDTDKTGSISKAELAGAMRVLDPKITDKELDDCFAAADANKDGEIAWEEFLQWLFGVDMSEEVWKIKRPQVRTALAHQFPDVDLAKIDLTLDRCGSNGGQAAILLKKEIPLAVRSRSA